MAHGMLGANPAELRALAQGLDARAGEIDRAGSEVSAEAGAVSWSGADAEAFRARVQEAVAPAILALG